MAGTLNNLGFLDRNQKRIEESRAHYKEAMAIYRGLAQGNSGRYADDIARVEAGLEELKRKLPLDRVDEMSRAQTLSRTRAQAGKRPKPKSPSVAGPFLAGKKLNAILCVLLAAVTIALYSPVLGYSFLVYDDFDYVTANPHIHGGLGWSTIKWAFTSTEAANWHPLTWLSHALDYQLLP